jgi:hypothetical protein
MERIIADTRDIYPIFWNRFFSNQENRLFENAYKKNDLEIELSKLFELLIFLISNIKEIYDDKCDSYIDILNMLCIYSVLSREINLILISNIKNRDILNDILIDFIDITSIIVNSEHDSFILLRMNNEESNKIFNDKILSSKSNSKNLFLKILNNL